MTDWLPREGTSTPLVANPSTVGEHVILGVI